MRRARGKSVEMLHKSDAGIVNYSMDALLIFYYRNLFISIDFKMDKKKGPGKTGKTTKDDDLYREMLELYTMVPPFPGKAKRKRRAVDEPKRQVP